MERGQFYTFVCIELRQGFHWRLPTGPQSGGKIIDATRFFFRGADLVRIEAGKHQRLVLACPDLGQAIQGIGAIRLEAVSARRPLPPFGIGLSFGAAKEPGEFDPGSASKASEWLAGVAPTGMILATERVALNSGDLDIFPFGFEEYGDLFHTNLGRTERVQSLTHPYLPLVKLVDGDETQRHNLPTSRGFFIGREAEIEELRSTLALNRSVTIVGASGCGKSALAQRLAWELIDEYRDGVRYVDLSGARAERDIAARMFDSLGIPTASIASLGLAAIRRHFTGRKHLVIFDGAESVRGFLKKIIESLVGSDGPKVLCTSHVPILSSGEWIYPLENLAIPTVQEGVKTPLAEFDSCVLLLDGLRRIRPSFQPSTEESLEIIEICRLLDGHPLGLMLHARRFRSESLAEMRASLRAKGGVSLEPGLNRSVQTTLLSISAKAVSLLEQASVFAGTWTRPDLQQVTGWSPKALRTPLEELLQALLVEQIAQANGSSRMKVQVHVREFLLSSLRKQGRLDGFRERHLLWMLDRYRTSLAGIEGLSHARHLESLDQVWRELESAMYFLIETRDEPDDFIDALRLSWSYWYCANRLQVAHKFLNTAKAKFRGCQSGLPLIYNALSIFATKSGDSEGGIRFARRAIKLLIPDQDQELLSKIHNNLGQALWANGNPALGLKAFRQAQEYANLCGREDLKYGQMNGEMSCFIDLNMPEDAAHVYRQIEAQLLAEDGPFGAWQAQTGRLELACITGELEEAELAMTQAMDTAENLLRDPELVGRLQLWEGEVRSRQGRYYDCAVAVSASRELLNHMDLRPHKVNERRLIRLERLLELELPESALMQAKIEGQLRYKHLV